MAAGVALTLASDPFFVCWSPTGAHRAAAIVAIVVGFGYGLCMPAIVFYWIWRDPWLAFELDALRVSAAARAAATKRDMLISTVSPLHNDGAFELMSNPLHLAAAGGGDRASAGASCHSKSFRIGGRVHGARSGPFQERTPPTANRRGLSLVAAPTALLPDPLLVPFLGDYRSAVWYTKHLDLGLLFALSLLQALLPRPVTLPLVLSEP
jgi:hypothetical protein